MTARTSAAAARPHATKFSPSEGRFCELDRRPSKRAVSGVALLWPDGVGAEPADAAAAVPAHGDWRRGGLVGGGGCGARMGERPPHLLRVALGDVDFDRL